MTQSGSDALQNLSSRTLHWSVNHCNQRLPRIYTRPAPLLHCQLIGKRVWRFRTDYPRLVRLPLEAKVAVEVAYVRDCRLRRRRRNIGNLRRRNVRNRKLRPWRIRYQPNTGSSSESNTSVSESICSLCGTTAGLVRPQQTEKDRQSKKYNKRRAVS